MTQVARRSTDELNERNSTTVVRQVSMCVVVYTASGWHLEWFCRRSIHPSLKCLWFNWSSVPSTTYQHQRVYKRTLYCPTDRRRSQVLSFCTGPHSHFFAPNLTTIITVGLAVLFHALMQKLCLSISGVLMIHDVVSLTTMISVCARWMIRNKSVLIGWFK